MRKIFLYLFTIHLLAKLLFEHGMVLFTSDRRPGSESSGQSSNEFMAYMGAFCVVLQQYMIYGDVFVFYSQSSERNRTTPKQKYKTILCM